MNPPVESDDVFPLIRRTLTALRRLVPAWREAVAAAPTLVAVAEVERAFTRRILEGES